MAHLLTPSTPLPRIAKKSAPVPCTGFHKVRACGSRSEPVAEENNFLTRRIALALSGAVVVVVGESISGRNAMAARRPPPPQQEEKKDPNMSGLTAKVLASKKRKEAMKESMANLREKGKIIQESSPQIKSSAD